MFDWLFTSQYQKHRNGYFINHDNLIIATPEERKKLIFYFIACQVSEKLDPTDRTQFNQIWNERLGNKSLYMGLGTATCWGLLFPYIGTKINRRIPTNLLLGFLGTTIGFYLGSSITYTSLEPQFVDEDTVVNSLAQKYNFTIFDFAQAKKEAHLKSLRREMLRDSLLTGY